MANELARRTALVFGVELPLGRKAAVALAEAGADVALVTLSEDTPAEFVANSIANEFWAIDRKSIVLTTDGREAALRDAIADASVNLGPISIFVYLAGTVVSREALSGLRSDPAIVVVVDEGTTGTRELLAWTRTLADAGLRANALAVSRAAADGAGPVLKEHKPPQPVSDVATGVVYLASDASAAVEGAMVVVET